MNAEQADNLIGIPYKDGAMGPDSFNCWGLLRYVQKVYFDVEMPLAPIGNAPMVYKMFKDHIEAAVWAVADKPIHGCGALMRAGDDPHVGVYLEIDGGGILHSLEGVGVIFTTIDQLNAQGFGRTKYYRLDNERESCHT